MAPVRRLLAAAEQPTINGTTSDRINRDARNGSDQSSNGGIAQETNSGRIRSSPYYGNIRFLQAPEFVRAAIIQLQYLRLRPPKSPQCNEDAYNKAVNEYNAQKDAHFDPNMESRNPLRCNICMNPYQDRAPTAVQCGHVYCRECIDRHIQIGNVNCVACNAAISHPLIRLFP